MSWRPIGHPRGYRVCRQHADRDHDPQDPFDLFAVFGLSRDETKGQGAGGFQRFPDFGKELRRPFKVHQFCFDCVELYDGCNAWPASRDMRTPDKKHLLCLDFLKLPDVMPGEPTGQVFPPSRMQGRKVPRERASTRADLGANVPKLPARKAQAPTRKIDPKRHCTCGRALPRRRRYCDTCQQARRRKTKLEYERERPERSHHGSGLPQDAPEGRPVAM